MIKALECSAHKPSENSIDVLGHIYVDLTAFVDQARSTITTSSILTGFKLRQSCQAHNYIDAGELQKRKTYQKHGKCNSLSSYCWLAALFEWYTLKLKSYGLYCPHSLFWPCYNVLLQTRLSCFSASNIGEPWLIIIQDMTSLRFNCRLKAGF